MPNQYVLRFYLSYLKLRSKHRVLAASTSCSSILHPLHLPPLPHVLPSSPDCSERTRDGFHKCGNPRLCYRSSVAFCRGEERHEKSCRPFTLHRDEGGGAVVTRMEARVTCSRRLVETDHVLWRGGIVGKLNPDTWLLIDACLCAEGEGCSLPIRVKTILIITRPETSEA